MDLNASRDVVTTSALGFHVARATDTLPQSTTEALFTVSGGRVEVRLMFGEVTTIIQNSDPVLSMKHVPTTGTELVINSTVATTSLEVGGFIHVTGTGSALVKSNAGAILSAALSGFIVPEGDISLVAGASKTGSVKWDLWYVPLDEGATVTAA